MFDYEDVKTYYCLTDIVLILLLTLFTLFIILLFI
jgi:hypothetical protein